MIGVRVCQRRCGIGAGAGEGRRKRRARGIKGGRKDSFETRGGKWEKAGMAGCGLGLITKSGKSRAGAAAGG